MDSISCDDVSSAIDDWLADRLFAESEPLHKKLKKTEPESEQAVEIEAELAALSERFSRQVWMEEAACIIVARKLKFGTHISKGVHSGSQGDNVNFHAWQASPKSVIGSQLLKAPQLDVTCDAKQLPHAKNLAAFFNTEIKGLRLYQLVVSRHVALKGVFAGDPEQSNLYQTAFYQALVSDIANPTSDGRNKQLLWPLEDAIIDDRYHCLIPLHPSALTHEVLHKINGRRFSDENEQAKENRKKNTAKQETYVSITSLAFTKLGGDHPKNVSLLTNNQGGRNLLLESLPPTYEAQHRFSISKKQETLFNRNLAYHCFWGLQSLFEVIEASRNNVVVRDQRKQSLSDILGQVLQLAAYVQKHYTPGWSESYTLKMPYKYWLDPQRAALENQESFRVERDKGDWIRTVMEDFSLWLNNQLKLKFKKLATEFDDTEYREWLKEMEATVKASQRAGEGVF